MTPHFAATGALAAVSAPKEMKRAMSNLALAISFCASRCFVPRRKQNERAQRAK